MGELERENSVIIIQKWVRGWLVRKQHIDFFKKIKIRRFVIKEIIGFEQTYISKLTYLLNNLKTPLLQDTSISHDKVENIFSNIDEIRQLHITIHNKLIETKPLIITEIYLEVLPKFTIYYPYVKNYNNAYKIYSNLLEEDEQFAQILDQFGYLPSFLILPVQHSPRYLLLFNELLKNTNIQNLDYKNLHKLIESIRETAKQINDCITSNENDDEDTSHFRNNSSGSINNGNGNNNGKGGHSKHNSVGGSIKRPASASDKRKPRNSIAMHKKAIDAVLSGDHSGVGGGGGNNGGSSDYSHLPSYLRPTQASSAWSRSKVEYSPSPKWRFSPATGSSFDQSYVYDNPLPTGMNPTSELFNDKHSTTLNLNNNNNTPKKQPSSSSLPPWKPPSKIISSTVDNCTKITKKTVFTRPISPPPPKPNFYSPSSAGSSTNSMNSSSSSISSISSGISSNSNSGNNTPSKATNLPLQQLTNNEISLSQSPFSSSKPPLSPSRHSTVNEKVIIEKLSISNENHTANSNNHHQTHHTTSTKTSSTTTTTTTKQVKKSLSSNNLFSQTPINNNSNNNNSSNKPSTPLIPPSSNNNNNNNDKSTPLSVVVSQ